MSLKAKTLFITGASRGIGLTIAKRAAADGANIVIAAKTTEPNPKLPGTIYASATEIKAAGEPGAVARRRYGILAFEHAPEWLPADFDPTSILVQSERS